MYRYYKKNEYFIMKYEFDSIIEFINYLENTEINTRIWSKNDLGSEDNDYDFCKTHSFKEALELLKYGYHENFDKFIELKKTLEKYIKISMVKRKQYNFYVGYAPDVKAYLEGSPLTMFNKQNLIRRHIDIYYNAAILGRVTSEQIFNRGVVTLCLIEILENMGFSVGLNVFTMSRHEGQIHYAKFNLKSPSERLNAQKLYFPLCHPSFLRRLVFRLREQTPDITSGWKEGYGSTCDDKTIRKIIDLKDNDIVICKPEEMGVCGNDIIDDANAMFEYISKHDLDIELGHVKRLTR